jgi:hypothetical protein
MVDESSEKTTVTIVETLIAIALIIILVVGIGFAVKVSKILSD